MRTIQKKTGKLKTGWLARDIKSKSIPVSSDDLEIAF